MPIGQSVKSVAALQRKLRGIVALLQDKGATQHERANAEALKARLEQRLRQAGVPEGDWTDIAFRLGRKVQELKKSTAPPAPTGEWTENAFRLGRVLGRGLKKWRAD
jgi:hypothetical protein